MIRASLEDLIRLVHDIESLTSPGDSRYPDVSGYLAMTALQAVSQKCEKLGLHVTRDLVETQMRLLMSGAPTTEQWHRFTEDFSGRLHSEGKLVQFLHLPPDRQEHFVNPREGWAGVIARFPDSATDIIEMRKCFALERYAASVFHGLQVIEIGLVALGGFIGVTDPHSGFTSVANELKRIMGTKFQERSALHQAHSPFLEQMQGTVEALKNAWRNKISHAQGRLVLMGTDFSQEIAEEIMLATRAFMRRLATELPT